MIGRQVVALLCILAVVRLGVCQPTFPPDFKFGAATAAYQIEGAWNASDKSANIWDVYTHKMPEKVWTGANADVACDSYHQWRRDVEMAHELKLDFYRFSIAWTRICPEGFCNRISKDGVAYYNNLIDGLLEKGIEPVATIYHWDLPQKLQELGGWANPYLADWFAAYARVVFTMYADRVMTWITINEPLIICDGSYSGLMAPGIDDRQYGVYMCSKTVLLAHAKAWRIYDEEFRPKYQGKISLSNHLIWYEPKTKADAPLASITMEFGAGRFSHPIFSKEGGWPPALEKLIADNSKKGGSNRSRLPPFTKEEIKLLRGTYDFYGMNFYTSRIVRAPKASEEIGPWPFLGSTELGVVLETRSDWGDTQSWWYKLNPRGLRDHLVWLKKQYGDPTILITENGVPILDPGLDDQDRVQFLKNHLRQVLLAITKDDVKVKAYTAWSLMDNFEWREGYSSKFGLYEVNFTDPDRTRTPRASASYYASVVKTHALSPPEEKGSYIVWICLGSALALIVLVGCVVKCYRDRTADRRKTYASVAVNNELRMKDFD